MTAEKLKLFLFYSGLFWLQAGQTSTVAGVNNLRGLLFFELMFMSMRAMLGALFTFPAEFKMMLKVTLLPPLPVVLLLVFCLHLVNTPFLKPLVSNALSQTPKRSVFVLCLTLGIASNHAWSRTNQPF